MVRVRDLVPARELKGRLIVHSTTTGKYSLKVVIQVAFVTKGGSLNHFSDLFLGGVSFPGNTFSFSSLPLGHAICYCSR